jgi:hypothetical protein
MTPLFATTSAQVDPLVKHPIHWILSKEVYNTRRDQIEGWTLAQEYSTDEYCCYSHNDFAIFAFRGTVNLKDVKADFLLAIGSPPTDRIKQGMEAIQAYIEETGHAVQVTGHSLGGAIARSIGQGMGLGIITFNAASPPSAPVINGPNEIDYHIAFDIISAWEHPLTIRIDKGYRPISHWITKISSYFGMALNTREMLRAHPLDQFSNARPGKQISNDEENAIWQKWFKGLSFRQRLVFLTFIKARSLPPV